MNRLLLFIFLLASCHSLQAATITWVPGNVGDWDDIANWSSGMIPGASDNVVINSGTATIPANYSTTILHLTVNAGATLNIGNNANLDFVGAGSEKIDLDGGSISNEGSITISGPSLVEGITQSGGTFFNASTGSITITNLSGNAIDISNGFFENEGIISISGNCENGIQLLGNNDFVNDNMISISEAEKNGIYIYGLGTGTMTFDNSSGATINISNFATSGSFEAGIEIYNVTSTVSFEFLNEGTLDISNPGGPFGRGILMDRNTLIHNKNGGLITMDNLTRGAFYANSSSTNAEINNDNGATMQLSNVYTGILLQNGRFKNDGLTQIGPTNGVGLETSQTSHNYSNGVIELTDTQLKIIGDTLYNENIISIVDGQGIQLGGGGILMNEVGSNINLLDNTSAISIASLTSEVNNFGTITSESNIGQGISNAGIIVNFPGGDISLDHSLNSDLRTGHNSSGTSSFDNQGDLVLSGTSDYGLDNGAVGTFTNSGSIEIESGHASWGFQNRGSFVNEACATFELQESMLLYSTSTLTNNGWFNSTFNGLHIDASSVFVNNGVIEDNPDAFANVTLTNNGYKCQEIPGTMQEGVAIPNALTGTGTDFTITSNKWYETAALLSEAGDFTPGSNEFTPGSAAVGHSTLYAQFNDVSNGCSKIIAINFENPIALPVELLDFTARTFNDKDVQLNWWTLTEENTSHFEIEHSIDGLTWENSGKVAAAGNTELMQNYVFTDADIFNQYPKVSTLLYRLRIVDLDGAVEYSPIESVKTTRLQTELSLFPNPSNNEFHVVSPSVDFNQLFIYNASGQLLHSLNLEEGRNTFRVKDLEMPQGVYTVMTLNDYGSRMSTRLVVVK